MKILATVSVLAALALGSSQALAASSHHNSSPRTLKVVMHDPGCHWFLVHGHMRTTTSVKGPIRLQNFDEAALKVMSRTKARIVHIGRSVILRHGRYVITMVGQASDDNYLKLRVR
jgi:hypothetical protein